MHVTDIESAKAGLLANWDGTDSRRIITMADQLTVWMGRFVQELPRVKIEKKNPSFTRLIVDGDEDRRRERQDRERKERFGDDGE
ncbi:hypothetical protein CN1A_26 [Clavibacter phage CN1A]|uniref:Uncharacterized protein n=1 Tax=Clavibacter phage CN1A TaxID=1406793 RepID=U5PT70_9CAUD|nr:hypothetical protein CN1A_26 [Clavibacter phage CN1A]AGY47135.1 hypothetical protein CN1A_26 [Clavibacter phage CN1A]